MIEFFSGLVGFFETLINFIIALFKNLLYLISAVPKAFVVITEVLAYFPPFITVPFMVLLSLSVILALINHWG